MKATRWLVALLGPLIVLVGCVRDRGFQCHASAACGDAGVCETTGYCSAADPACGSGRRYQASAGSGLAAQCVGDDAGVDAGAPDAATPVVQGQSAELVLGQDNLTTASFQAESASSIGVASQVGSDGVHLWVSDWAHARVLQWNQLPTTDHASADLVIGQPTMTAHTLGTARGVIAGPRGLAVGARHLVVADETNSRVLIWNDLPTTNGPDADLVLGQTTFTTSAPGTAMDRLNAPTGIWTDGVRLAVADTGNDRVLIWQSFPGRSGQVADLVLGGSGAPSATTMKAPAGVWFDGNRFMVADTGNQRVLVWDGFPITIRGAADRVLGQPDFARNQPGVGPASMSHPVFVIADAGSLLVVDDGNSRVLVFAPVPRSSGASAAVALGQLDLFSSAAATTVSGSRLEAPKAAIVAGNYLWVSDGWPRVLAFRLHQ